MKIQPSKHQSGLALICVIILVAAVLIIAGSIVYMLYSLCKRVLPPTGGGGDTNNITAVFTYDNVTNFAEAGPIQVPTLKFPELAKPPGWTAENPFGLATMELQRSTNLIDWETICVSTNPGQVLTMDDDTNPPPDRAFYRGRFVIP